MSNFAFASDVGNAFKGHKKRKRRKTVYVVMGNDYPDAVFDSAIAAEAFCKQRREEDKNRGMPHRIYWRFYSFEVQR